MRKMWEILGNLGFTIAVLIVLLAIFGNHTAGVDKAIWKMSQPIWNVK